MNANENLGKKRKNAIAIVKMGSVFMNIGIIFPYCLLVMLTITDQRTMGLLSIVILAISGLIAMMAAPLLVSGFLLFLIGLLIFVLVLIVMLKKTNENLGNAMVEFGFVLMKSNIITLFCFAVQGNDTVVTIPFISLKVPLYIGTLPFVSGFLLFLIGLLINLIGRPKKSARKTNENLEKKKKNARAIVEIGVALMGGSILLLLYSFYSDKSMHAFHVDSEIGAGFYMRMMLLVLIGELIFVLGFLMLLIVLLVGLIGQLKKFACKANDMSKKNDLERETNAGSGSIEDDERDQETPWISRSDVNDDHPPSMCHYPNALMRDPKQTGQSLSEESHPSRRTVIAALVATGGVAAGGGAIWWVLTPHPLYVYRGHATGVDAVAWSPDGKRIASSAFNDTVQVWDAVDGSHVFTYKGHYDGAQAVAWSPDGKRIASASWDSTVQVWDAVDGGHVFTYKGHSSGVKAVAWSPDGKRIASGSEDKTVQVWDAVDGSHVFTYKGHSGFVNAVAWSPNGKRIASGSSGDYPNYDDMVQVWDAVDGSHVFTHKGYSDGTQAVAWSPDSKRIASGSGDNTVQVWDAVDGSHVFTYKGHSDWTRTVLETVVSVNAVAWSPDGKRIASSSGDNTVQVWDAVDGSHVFTYKGHSDTVEAVAWSPDGKRVASGSEDKTVQVWEAS